MRRWRKLRALGADARWLLLEAAAVVVALRVVSYFVSFKVLLRSVERAAARREITQRSRLAAEQVGWAVEHPARVDRPASP